MTTKENDNNKDIVESSVKTKAPAKKAPAKKAVRKNAPKTPEAEQNQARGRFKPGQSGNSTGWTFRKPTREFREKCHAMIMKSGIEMLVNLMYKSYEEGKTSEALDILKFIAGYAYGTPATMKDCDDPEPTLNDNKNILPTIVVSKDAILDTIKSDEDYI